MTRLVEDYLNEEEYEAIARVLQSNVLRFDKLVEIAGLNPAEDFTHTDLRNINFCGADLRGFDFTGSDLRGSTSDERTLIDDTTILNGAKTDWIAASDIQMVQLMQEVQAAASSPLRRAALETLEQKYGKTEHVIEFVVNAAREAPSTQAFLDYADFLPSNLPAHRRVQVIDAGVRALKRKFAKSRARTGRDATTNFAASPIAEHLMNARDSFAADWFESLAKIMDTDRVNDALKGTTASIKKDQIILALENLRQTRKEAP